VLSRSPDSASESATAQHSACSLTRSWAVIASIFVVLLLVLSLLWQGLRLTEGRFTYALDDAYIHMALAKNFVKHGVLGATPYEFTSASSSPLWTVMLITVFSVFGVQEMAPLLLCVVSAIGVLLLTDYVMVRNGLPAGWRFFGLLWIVFVTPIAPIIFGGMEHPTQVLIDLALVSTASLSLARPEERLGRDSVLMAGLALLATAVRYEGAVLVGVVCVACIVRGRWKTAALLLAAAAVPVTLYGLYSLSQGGYFLPNSVLVKGSGSGIGSLDNGMRVLVSAAVNVRYAYPLAALMIASLAVSLDETNRMRLPFWRASNVFSVIAVSTAAVHLALGSVGWFYRYEAYLFVLVSLGLLIQTYRRVSACRGVPGFGNTLVGWSVVTALLIAAVGGSMRAHTAVRVTPLATRNIFEQQVQMALFVRSNRGLRTVVLNDLGAIAFFNDDLRLVDLVGLGMRRPSNEMLKDYGGVSSSEMSRLAQQSGARLAVVYPDWFAALPSDWVPVASWTIRDNVVAGSDTVVFYAIPPQDPEELRSALANFEPRLPPTVESVDLLD